MATSGGTATTPPTPLPEIDEAAGRRCGEWRFRAAARVEKRGALMVSAASSLLPNESQPGRSVGLHIPVVMIIVVPTRAVGLVRSRWMERCLNPPRNAPSRTNPSARTASRPRLHLWTPVLERSRCHLERHDPCVGALLRFGGALLQIGDALLPFVVVVGEALGKPSFVLGELALHLPTSWPNNRSFLFCIVFNSRSADSAGAVGHDDAYQVRQRLHFNNLLSQKGHSDQELFNGASTDNIVRNFASSPSAFSSAFVTPWEGTREGEVVGSNPSYRVACEKSCDWAGLGGCPVGHQPAVLPEATQPLGCVARSNTAAGNQTDPTAPNRTALVSYPHVVRPTYLFAHRASTRRRRLLALVWNLHALASCPPACSFFDVLPPPCPTTSSRSKYASVFF
ncbi:hypothetical protein HU200_060635 [Digitaria exilis]|uniref:Uncharacterized protein n=1 Tax=Digitaria exilis TaxID=1010633 RepID=A0A835A670_9POAL|nr:hypothetical protein HU200_060635 [Digitaria exilis]